MVCKKNVNLRLLGSHLWVGVARQREPLEAHPAHGIAVRLGGAG